MEAYNAKVELVLSLLPQTPVWLECPLLQMQLLARLGTGSVLLNSWTYPCLHVHVARGEEKEQVHNLATILRMLHRVSNIQVMVRLTIDRPFPDLTSIVKVLRGDPCVRLVLVQQERSPMNLLSAFSKAARDYQNKALEERQRMLEQHQKQADEERLRHIELRRQKEEQQRERQQQQHTAQMARESVVAGSSHSRSPSTSSSGSWDAHEPIMTAVTPPLAAQLGPAGDDGVTPLELPVTERATMSDHGYDGDADEDGDEVAALVASEVGGRSTVSASGDYDFSNYPTDRRRGSNSSNGRRDRRRGSAGSRTERTSRSSSRNRRDRRRGTADSRGSRGSGGSGGQRQVLSQQPSPLSQQAQHQPPIFQRAASPHDTGVHAGSTPPLMLPVTTTSRRMSAETTPAKPAMPPNTVDMFEVVQCLVSAFCGDLKPSDFLPLCMLDVCASFLEVSAKTARLLPRCLLLSKTTERKVSFVFESQAMGFGSYDFRCPTSTCFGSILINLPPAPANVAPGAETPQTSSIPLGRFVDVETFYEMLRPLVRGYRGPSAKSKKPKKGNNIFQNIALVMKLNKIAKRTMRHCVDPRTGQYVLCHTTWLRACFGSVAIARVFLYVLMFTLRLLVWTLTVCGALMYVMARPAQLPNFVSLVTQPAVTAASSNAKTAATGQDQKHGAKRAKMSTRQMSEHVSL